MNFILEIFKDKNKILEPNTTCTLQYKNISITFEKDNRNISDSFLYEDENHIIVNIGVFFDTETVIDRTDYYPRKIISEYNESHYDFPNVFRGCFCGVIFDKTTLSLMAYTDHTSCRRLFYYEYDDCYIFSSNIELITNNLNSKKLDVNLDIDGALMLLQHGYMIGESTLVKNLVKLKPGSTISVDGTECHVNTYFDVCNVSKIQIAYNEAIDIMESLFKKAINLEFNRDYTNSTKHLITLSGGLDSRAVRIVSHDMDYKNVTNITMSQSFYLDHTISMKISSDLLDDYIFFSLDNGKYLYEKIEESCINNGATVLYNGNAHIDKMIDSINLSNHGLLHTGMIGDVVAGGSFIQKKQIDIKKGLYSRINTYVKGNFNETKYKTHELYLLYNRGINGAYNGIYSSQRKIEAFSPFIDPDFIQFMFSLPDEYRNKSKIYISWMKRYHPKMLQYVWEKTGSKPDANKLLVIAHKTIRYAKRRLFVNKLSMNPYDFWYNRNIKFRKEIDSSLEKAIEYIQENDLLMKVISNMKERKETINKLLIISLGYSIKSLNIKVGESYEL